MPMATLEGGHESSSRYSVPQDDVTREAFPCAREVRTDVALDLQHVALARDCGVEHGANEEAQE